MVFKQFYWSWVSGRRVEQKDGNIHSFSFYLSISKLAIFVPNGKVRWRLSRGRVVWLCFEILFEK